MNKIKYIAAAIVLAVTGMAIGHQFADAAIPDSTTGAITACLNDDHAVRIIDAEASAVCNGSETALSWLANGGTVYEDYAVGPVAVPSSTVVASLTVPPGRYEITAKTWADFSPGSATFAQCGLVGVGGNDNSRIGASGVLTVLATDDFPSGATIDYACVVNDDVDFYRISLHATTVSAIVSQ